MTKSGEDYPTEVTVLPVKNQSQVIYFAAVYAPLSQAAHCMREAGRMLADVTTKFDLILQQLNYMDNSFLSAKGLPALSDEGRDGYV